MTALRSLALAALLAAVPAAAASPPAASLLPGERELAPLVREGEPRVFQPDTLWEKIDGEAELYRRYGVREAASAGYSAGGDPERRVEVTVFELAGPLNAFGVFAGFRSPTDPVLGIGAAAVMRDYQGFFRQGRYFVLADVFGPDDRRPGDLRAALEAAAARLSFAADEPPLLAAFERLVRPGTSSYLPDHLLGRADLPPGLEGETPDGLRVFIASRPAAGEKVLDAYQAVLKGARRLAIGGAPALAGEDPALGPVVLAAGGGRLAGARAPDTAPRLGEILPLLLALPPGTE